MRDKCNNIVLIYRLQALRGVFSGKCHAWTDLEAEGLAGNDSGVEFRIWPHSEVSKATSRSFPFPLLVIFQPSYSILPIRIPIRAT